MKTDLSDKAYGDQNILQDYPQLHRYLNYAWLKPLDGVWDATIGTQLSKIDFPSPSLDIGCGDGIYGSIFMGVKYAESFEVVRMVL